MLYPLSVVITSITCPYLIVTIMKKQNGSGNYEPLIISFSKGVQGPPGSRGIQGHEASFKNRCCFLITEVKLQTSF